MRHLRVPLLALFLLLAVGTQSASAECRNVYKYVPYPPYGDLVLECDNATPPKGGKPKKKKAKPKPKPPTRAQLRALRYKPRASVSEKLKPELITRLAKGDFASQIQAQIQSGERLSSYMVVLSSIHNTYKKAGEGTRASLARYDVNDRSRSWYFFGKSMFLVTLTRKGVID